MSIFSNDAEFKEAQQIAYISYPRAEKYPNAPEKCHHINETVIYCDGIWDILRCPLCGREEVVHCNFDDDYN